MAQRRWTKELILDSYRLPWDEFSRRHPNFTNYNGYRRMRWNVLHGKIDVDSHRDIPAPPPIVRKFESPPHVDEASFFFFSDFHAPHHNQDMLQRALMLKRIRYPHIALCIVGGDLFNFESISAHGNDQPSIDLEEEQDAVRGILEVIGAHFKTCYLLLGNHDRRFARRLNARVKFQYLINGVLGSYQGPCTFIAVDHDYMYVDHPERPWIVGHPSRYSRIGGSTPVRIAEIHRRNVICGHNHIVGVQRSACGYYVGIDAGHMTDETRHHYAVTHLTTHPRWQSGFVVVDNGYPFVYDDRFTDWDRLIACAKRKRSATFAEKGGNDGENRGTADRRAGTADRIFGGDDA